MGDMYDCWLGYEPLGTPSAEALSRVSGAGAPAVLRTALDELTRGLSALTGKVPALVPSGSPEPHVAVEGPDFFGLDYVDKNGEAMLISARVRPGTIVITGSSDGACLHAVFEFLRRVQAGEDLSDLHVIDVASNELRIVNHWDNIDGSIERGYAGNSIFFADGEVVTDLSRVRDYARLLASTAVNGVTINNVNVTRESALLITRRHLPDVARIAGVFREYGIRLFLSISFDSPIAIGGVRTADPCDPLVASWWRERVADVYSYIPDFGGFLVKADSESRPGPSVYGRSQAEGANVLAEALRPFGGVVIWRAFVYDCYQDWRDRSTDRARACYDTFMPLDGDFAENAIVQVKLGPMDFQVREPDSPLLTAFRRTSQAIEVQITQEYTGQQKDLCFLYPQWHEVMSVPASSGGAETTLAQVVSGHATGRPWGGVTGVANVGDDPSWTGNVLAQANLYAFGRLAWDPTLSPRTVAEEWVAQTFGHAVSSEITTMLLESWGIYESYTAPLGVGWMVTPHYHYGPDIDGYEYSRWGTYHFADRDGIGVDRTAATGTGYTSQYPADRAAVYEDVATCPDDLLLFFHHVPYTHVLHSGKTVIQHIYDSHFDGADAARGLLETWQSLEGRVDPARFAAVRARFELQVANAEQWRDIVNTYFFRKSGIVDEKGRVIY